MATVKQKLNSVNPINESRHVEKACIGQFASVLVALACAASELNPGIVRLDYAGV